MSPCIECLITRLFCLYTAQKLGHSLRSPLLKTLKTGVCYVLPVNNAVFIDSKSRLVALVQHTDVFPARVAVLGVEGLEAGAAVRPTLLHDVALAPQHRLALEAAEVLHVPVTALRLRALVRQDDLRKEREAFKCRSLEAIH